MIGAWLSSLLIREPRLYIPLAAANDIDMQLGVLEISRSMVIGFMIQLISLRVMIMILILAMYFTMWLQMTAF